MITINDLRLNLDGPVGFLLKFLFKLNCFPQYFANSPVPNEVAER